MKNNIRLGDIAVISAGQGAPQGTEYYSEYGTPFVKAGDLIDLISGKNEDSIQKVTNEVAEKYKLRLYPKGTVVFAKSGMSCMKGYVYTLKTDCYVVNHLACITPHSIESEYLRYFFEYHRPNKLVKDAAYPSISLADITEMTIIVFDNKTRCNIVQNLDTVSDIIEKKKQELLLLNQLVKSRFIEMFGLLEKPAKDFSRDILKNLCTKITDGKHGGCTSEMGTGRYFVGAREIYDDTVHYDTAPEINLYEFEKDYKRCNVEIGDFLIVNTGATIGKSAIAVDPRTECTLLQKSVALLKVKRGLLNPIFLQYCYRVNDGMYKVDSASAQPNLLLSKINSTEIYVPPIILQNQFAAFVEQTDKLKFEVKEALEKLEILKKSLMQQYFG